MMFKRGVLIIIGIIILLIHLIISSAKAYRKEERSKVKMQHFMRNPYDFGSYKKHFS